MRSTTLAHSHTRMAGACNLRSSQTGEIVWSSTRVMSGPFIRFAFDAPIHDVDCTGKALSIACDTCPSVFPTPGHTAYHRARVEQLATQPLQSTIRLVALVVARIARSLTVDMVSFGATARTSSDGTRIDVPVAHSSRHASLSRAWTRITHHAAWRPLLWPREDTWT
jgi:hypothetical protein